jgi:uncharacterized protein (TIGR03790 family)
MVYVALLGALLGCSRPAVTEVPVRGPVSAEGRRVLVVVNRASETSRALGGYYANKRGVPKENVLLLDLPEQEEIRADVYWTRIDKPLYAALKASKNPIDFIVTTKGVPIRIYEGGVSVDAFIACTGNGAIKQISRPDDENIRRAANPYFGKDEPFSHRKFNIYLTTRLDGYTLAQAKALVDNSLAAKRSPGRFYFDNRPSLPPTGGYGEMERAMKSAVDKLKSKGYVALLDGTNDFTAPPEPVMGYASWGSNDASFKLDTYRKLKFKPGALAETFVSTSGRTFLPTTGGQSLVADLIQQGVTGVKGYVHEPYTFALARADILFDRYTSGYNLAESFYMASPVMRWKDVVIGDPLCAPYAK